MAQAQPEFGLTLPILLPCCSEFLKRALEIWRPWSINCDGRGPSRVLGGLSATRKQSSLTGCRLRFLVLGPWGRVQAREWNGRFTSKWQCQCGCRMLADVAGVISQNPVSVAHDPSERRQKVA